MFTSFSRYFYKFLKLLDFLLFFLVKRNLISKLKEYLAEDSFKKILINKKEVTFFSPNSLVDWRIDTFFSKEPETLDWIRKFDKKKDIIFWDIGANIGLYTIYAGLTHSNCKIVNDFKLIIFRRRQYTCTLSHYCYANYVRYRLRLLISPHKLTEQTIHSLGFHYLFYQVSSDLARGSYRLRLR